MTSDKKNENITTSTQLSLILFQTKKIQFDQISPTHFKIPDQSCGFGMQHQTLARFKKFALVVINIATSQHRRRRVNIRIGMIRPCHNPTFLPIFCCRWCTPQFLSIKTQPMQSFSACTVCDGTLWNTCRIWNCLLWIDGILWQTPNQKRYR